MMTIDMVSALLDSREVIREDMQEIEHRDRMPLLLRNHRMIVKAEAGAVMPVLCSFFGHVKNEQVQRMVRTQYDHAALY